MLKKIKVLSLLFFGIYLQMNAQDNSPYSRYGIGDLTPGSNILNRGMGGISAGFADPYSVNFNNPASYSSFQSLLEERTKKSVSGRVVLDVGINLDNRKLREVNDPQSFTASNLYFSYLQLGIPVRKNIGINFGLRPISRISYKIGKREMLFDPNTNLPIDSADTEFAGDGGTYLASTGFGIGIKNLSIGVNGGFMFGNKNYSTKRAIFNDSVTYNISNHETKVSYGDLYFSGGMQYKAKLNKSTTLRLGVSGNLKHELSAKRDIIRETITRTAEQGDFRLDSVTEQLEEKGKITYPSSFTAGFVVERTPDDKKGGWLFGIDFTQSGWDEYRFFGQADPLQNNWQLKIGGQIRPVMKTIRYKSFVSYRAGVFFGNDYVYLNKKLPEFGVSFGMGLPVLNLKDAQRRFRTQYSVLNLSVEYIKRGNNNNILRENLFRISAGFALSDLWFVKRKYD